MSPQCSGGSGYKPTSFNLPQVLYNRYTAWNTNFKVKVIHLHSDIMTRRPSISCKYYQIRLYISHNAKTKVEVEIVREVPKADC